MKGDPKEEDLHTNGAESCRTCTAHLQPEGSCLWRRRRRARCSWAQPHHAPCLTLKIFMNWLRSISLSLLRVIYDTGERGRATDSRPPNRRAQHGCCPKKARAFHLPLISLRFHWRRRGHIHTHDLTPLSTRKRGASSGSRAGTELGQRPWS